MKLDGQSPSVSSKPLKTHYLKPILCFSSSSWYSYTMYFVLLPDKVKLISAELVKVHHVCVCGVCVFQCDIVVMRHISFT